jgi:hypothetical protein
LNDQVFADEIRGIKIIGQDAAYLGGSQKNVVGPLAFEEDAYRSRVRKIQFRVRSQQEAIKAVLLQLAADGGAYQPAVTSYIDETVFLQGSCSD